MSIYFTSDTHFSSERTLQFSRRPFTNVDEMDNALISNWNTIVQPSDQVFHLGDFGDFSKLQYLNGRILFILGNYERDDKTLDLSSLISDNFQIKYLNKGDIFNLDVKHNNTTYQFELVHEPSWAMSNKFVLFGHVHEKCTMKRNGLNVGVDCHHYKPINMETVLFYQNAICNYYDDEVWSDRCGK